MLLYADQKLEQLNALATQLNLNAQEAKTLLSSTNIKSAMQSNFSELESSTNASINKLKTTLTQEINTELESAKKSLESANTQNLNTQVQEFLTDEKIKSLFDFESAKEHLTQSFLSKNTDSLNAKITNTLNLELKTTILDTLTPALQTELEQTLDEQVKVALNSALEDLHISEVEFSDGQLQEIVRALLNSQAIQTTLREEFSAHLNEKLHTNTDLQNALNAIFAQSIDSFFSAQNADFKHFLLKTHALFTNQVCALSSAYATFRDHALAELQLDLQHSLDLKRQEYQNKLKDPQAIVHNVYQRI